MTQAIVVPASFTGQVAAAFQGQQTNDDMSGGITGGYGLIKYRGKVWSIQHNGASFNLMRDDGDGPRGSIDVVIIKANPHLSKTFYINGWDENNNNPPDCASANGIVPDQGVPHKQADVCATCPRNAWGSAQAGGKGKACGDHRRMAVVPLTDLRNEALGGPMLLRCPAASLQDMATFDARYKAMGYPYFTMAIKISFDPQESFPKFVFQAIRPLTDQEAPIIIEHQNSPLTARVVAESTAPAPAQIAAPPQAAFLEPAPVNAVAPVQQVAVQPSAPVAQPAAAQPQPAVQQSVAVPQPQQRAAGGNGANPPAGGAVNAGGGFGPVATAQPPGQPAQQPTAGAPAQAGGFGPAVASGGQPVVQSPQPVVQQQAAAQAQPQRAMTGFGNVTPEVTPQPAPQAAPQPAQAPQQEVLAPNPAPNPAPAPGVVAAFEGSIDERLAKLIEG